MASDDRTVPGRRWDEASTSDSEAADPHPPGGDVGAEVDTPAFRGVTIDAATSRDLDDAIWVEGDDRGWQVIVCVADVCSGVAVGSPDDDDARQTGFSRYAAARTVRPMLPRRLSEGGLSLLPGGSRRVFGAVLRLSADLDCIEVRFGFGCFEHLGRLTHERASELIDGGEPRLHAMMSRAWKLCSGLLDARRRGGALAFASAGSGVVADEEGHLVDTGVRGPVSRAYVVVQELMILTNRVLAEHFARAGVPLLYRNHRANPVADRAALQQDLAIAAQASAAAGAARGRLDMMLERASLGPKASGHFGLNVPVYACFTSPIRRYADLVNQRVIQAVLLGREPPYSVAELDALAGHLNAVADAQAEERSVAFKRASERRAERGIERRDFGALGDADFRAILKAVFAAGDGEERRLVPVGLCDEALSRLASGRLEGKDVARVLLSGAGGIEALKAGVVRALEGDTALAMAALNHLGQARDAAPPVWEEASSGPPHAPVFRCVAAVLLGGVKRCGEAVVAGRKDEARQRAVVALLSRLSGVMWSPPPAWSPGEGRDGTAGVSAEPDRPVRSADPAAFGLAADNPKGGLQELCQARRWPMPVYDVAQFGPPHKPCFEACVSIAAPAGGVASPKVKAGSRKEAEKLAAAALLGVLADGVEGE